jgi:hypothetical protein
MKVLTLSTKVSVTGLVKILSFGQNYLAVGKFFQEKIAQIIGRNFSGEKIGTISSGHPDFVTLLFKVFCLRDRANKTKYGRYL